MGGVNWIPAEHLRAAQWFNEEPTMVIGNVIALDLDSASLIMAYRRRCRTRGGRL